MGLQAKTNGSRAMSSVSVMVTKAFRSPNIGYAYGLLAGLAYGGWSVIAKTAITKYDVPPLLFATTAFAFGSLMFAFGESAQWLRLKLEY